jgi:hypothetical protein
MAAARSIFSAQYSILGLIDGVKETLVFVIVINP